MSIAGAFTRYCQNCGAQISAAAQTCEICRAPTPPRSQQLDDTDPAPVGLRVKASALDVAPLIALLLASVIAATVAEPADWFWWGVALLSTIWCLVLWGQESATGQTPGKSLLGLRVVQERTGSRLGLGRTLLRLAGKAAATICTLGIASGSYRWDPTGREQCWWDVLAGSRVIAGSTEGLALPAAAAHPQWIPARQSQSQTQPPYPLSDPSFFPLPPVLVPPIPPPLILPPAVVQGWAEPTTVIGHHSIADADPASELPTSVVTPDELSDAPTGVHTRVLIKNADTTVSRAISSIRPITATLEWDSGTRVTVGGAVLVGRDPQAGASEKIDRRLAVGTHSTGVSKTHLLLSMTTAGITVTDRNSTNGVRVQGQDGQSVICIPGEPTRVREGDRIVFGGRSIRIVPDG